MEGSTHLIRQGIESMLTNNVVKMPQFDCLETLIKKTKKSTKFSFLSNGNSQMSKIGVSRERLHSLGNEKRKNMESKKYKSRCSKPPKALLPQEMLLFSFCE